MAYVQHVMLVLKLQLMQDTFTREEGVKFDLQAPATSNDSGIRFHQPEALLF